MPKDPVQDFLDQKQKLAAQRAGEDLDLWHQWNNGGRKAELLEPLMQRYTPLMARKTKEWRAPAVAESAFKMELKKQFVGAAQTFDPERGVAFNTHVQNRLRKAQRYNTRHQNVGYIPEGQAKNIGPLQQTQNLLSEQFGRAPTSAEIADHMNLSEAHVTGLMQAMRKDVPSSIFETDPASFSTSRESDVIRLIQKRPSDYLSPEEANVFNHIFGVNGARKITDTTGLASQLGISQPKVSRLKTSIGQKIKKHL